MCYLSKIYDLEDYYPYLKFKGNKFENNNFTLILDQNDF